MWIIAALQQHIQTRRTRRLNDAVAQIDAGKTVEDNLYTNIDPKFASRDRAGLGMRSLYRTTSHTEWTGD